MAVLDPAARSQYVGSVLERYKAVTMEKLIESLPAREPRRHLYDLVPLYPQRAGKGLRPALCLATCQAFGGSLRGALPSAVAIELFHNAFLVHDDVEDGSISRRGLPTLAAEFGLPIAVNVGDAMNVLSLRPLMDNLGALGPTLAWRVFEEIEHMVRESVEGQALELGWVHDNACEMSDEDYLRMILKKTCWYTCIHPCRIGALIGSGGAVDLERFNRFGYFMGAAFQIQDDLLNLVGDEVKYGKEIGGDIWEGKRTLVLIHTLNHASAREKVRIRRFLATARAERSPGDVAWVYELMHRYHSMEYARGCARQLAEAALDEFGVAYAGLPETPDKVFIHNIVLYMIERDL